VTIRSRLLESLAKGGNQGIEDVALSLLALRGAGADPVSLLRVQDFSGAWHALPGAGSPSVFHTALALLALRGFRHPSCGSAAEHAFRWLSEVRGLESHWLWQWKFRLFDRQVRFDPTKSGWPWVPGTVCWVAPTALAVLAFRSWRRESPRVAGALEMLLDRSCPRGGWNAGNSVVFGVELDPHPDFTAMAILALRHSPHASHAIVHRSLEYLPRRLNASCSPYSLAWAVLALSAYEHPGAAELRERLEAAIASRMAVFPPRTLALAALALEQPPFTFEEIVP
jgi:hypothetical protein